MSAQRIFERVGDGLVLLQPHDERVADPSSLLGSAAGRLLVVASKRFEASPVKAELDAAGIDYAVFSGFSPNPVYEDVEQGVAAFKELGCGAVMSVGGGSAIDTAKCIKLFAAMEDGPGRLCDRELVASGVPHIAVPTTAGTGSESTHFAVLYVDGEKRSVAHPSAQPDVAVLDPRLIATVPAYHRAAAFLDALCQAIESHWSARSTDESRGFSAAALRLLADRAGEYLASNHEADRDVLVGANLAGRAINLTTTTAAHAMSYKLTSTYGLAHGHAVALCLPGAWRMLAERGDEASAARLREVSSLLTKGASADPAEGLAAFERVFAASGLAAKASGPQSDAEMLASSVNAQRLSNFPVPLSHEDLAALYREVLAT